MMMMMMMKVVLPLLAALLSVGLCGQLGGMIGAPADISPTDERVQNALNFAVAEHNRQSNDLYIAQSQDVIKVQRQLVAGNMYIITVKMEKTNCRKGAATEVCNIQEDPEKAKVYECTFRVWERPWINSIILDGEKCN